MKVLVFVEQRDGKIKPSAFETLTAGFKLAGSSANMAAVIVGGSVGKLASELAGWGVDKVFTVEGAAFENYNVSNYAAALHDAVKAFSPEAVIGPASAMGRDLFPRIAARMDAGLATDLVEVALKGTSLTGTKPMYSGKVLATVSLKADGLQMATIRPNVIPAVKPGQGQAAPQALAVTPPASSRIKTVDVRKGKSARADLTEASIIVSGGRAMGNADAFKLLHDCADTLGATVGASRAAVDAGFAPHDMQVGQTGKTVNPNLYIACGISGAIQHLAGMRTSKVIVAINTDKDAPIFTVANYGIVADLFQVVPVLTAKLKAMLG